MQNFEIKNKLLSTENKNQIKKLWLNNFLEDDEKTVDCFLENVFENKKGVGAFFNNELVAMILFLNSKIIFKDINKNAVYFYAVCTDEKHRNKGIMKNLFSYAKEKAKEQGFEICFLVPENEELFKMYEKFSFKRTICYEERLINVNQTYNKNTVNITTGFCYIDYKAIRLATSQKTPVVVWSEKEFEFIFNKNRSDVSFVFSKSAYAVYEKQKDEILVFEFCGNEKEILSLIFSKENDYKKIRIRVPVEAAKTDFGMTFNLVDSGDDINSIYFGMPYG